MESGIQHAVGRISPLSRLRGKKFELGCCAKKCAVRKHAQSIFCVTGLRGVRDISHCYYVARGDSAKLLKLQAFEERRSSRFLPLIKWF